MDKIKTWLLVGLLRGFACMSHASRQRAGRLVAWLAFKLAGRRVRIARRNLELCFPNESTHTRERWLREHFRALGQSFVDRGVLWYGTPEAIRDLVGVQGYEHVIELQAQGRPILGLAPHFVALDTAATRLTMELKECATLYTPQRDAAVDRIVYAGRGRFNTVHLISRHAGVRELIRHLRAGYPVYYLPDMDFGPAGSVFAPFFGIPAATLLSTAQLAQKWQAAVLPILSFWDPATGRYQVEVLPPLADFPGEDSPQDAVARLNQEIEGWIRRCPSQYYWVHRRFKTRPEGEPPLY